MGVYLLTKNGNKVELDKNDLMMISDKLYEGGDDMGVMFSDDACDGVDNIKDITIELSESKAYVKAQKLEDYARYLRDKFYDYSRNEKDVTLEEVLKFMLTNGYLSRY